MAASHHRRGLRWLSSRKLHSAPRLAGGAGHQGIMWVPVMPCAEDLYGNVAFVLGVDLYCTGHKEHEGMPENPCSGPGQPKHLVCAGCMAALQAEQFLAAHEELEDGRTAEAAIAEDDAGTAEAVRSTEHLAVEAVALANGIHAKENAAANPVPA